MAGFERIGWMSIPTSGFVVLFFSEKVPGFVGLTHQTASGASNFWTASVRSFERHAHGEQMHPKTG